MSAEKVVTDMSNIVVDEGIERVLDLVSEGMSVRCACDAVGISRGFFLRHVDEIQYAHARVLCADAHFDELGVLAGRIADGTVDAQAGRVASDIVKWRLGRMRPDVYADVITRSNVEHSGAVEHAHSLTPAVSELIERIKGEQ